VALGVRAVGVDAVGEEDAGFGVGEEVPAADVVQDGDAVRAGGEPGPV